MLRSGLRTLLTAKAAFRFESKRDTSSKHKDAYANPDPCDERIEKHFNDSDDRSPDLSRRRPRIGPTPASNGWPTIVEVC